MGILQFLKMLLIPLSYLVSNCIYEASPRLKKEQKQHQVEEVVIKVLQDVLEDIIDEPKEPFLESPEHQEMIGKIERKISGITKEDVQKYCFQEKLEEETWI